MRHRHLFAVDGIGHPWLHALWGEMRDDLVAEQVEIDPMIGATSLRTTEELTIKMARRRKVVDWEGEVEGPECHTGAIVIERAAKQ